MYKICWLHNLKWLITKTYYRSSCGREIEVVQNLLVAQLRLLITEVIDDFPFGRRKSHKCLIAKLSRSTELFHELFAHLKEFFVTVPVALEEFAGDLETETKEEVDNQELAKGNGMHEINHSKRNIICIYLILQFTSLIVSRKKLITAQITFLLARRLAPLCWAKLGSRAGFVRCVAGWDTR